THLLSIPDDPHPPDLHSFPTRRSSDLRTPNIETLLPEQGMVTIDKAGITVNEVLQSISNPNVYAAGDAAKTSGDPLTPVGSKEADDLSRDLVRDAKQTMKYTGKAYGVCTSQKRGRVGISVSDSNERKLNVHYTDAADFFTYSHLQTTYAQAKIITDVNDEYILGAHLISNQADELINYFAMAIQLNIKKA